MALKYGSRDTDNEERDICIIAEMNGGEAPLNEGEAPLALSNSTPPGYKGLENLGNTCFMNASLQCLFNTVPLIAYYSRADLEPTVFDGDISKEFAVLLRRAWTNTGSPHPISPSLLKLSLSNRHVQFQGYMQHDAQEFFSCLLNELKEDLERPVNRTIAAEDAEAQRGPSQSVISDIFYGQLHSTLRCSICQTASETRDPFLTLPLPIPELQVEISVFVFRRNSPCFPLTLKVPVCKNTKIFDVKKFVSEKAGLPVEALRIPRTEKGFITGLAEDDALVLTLVQPSSSLHVFEVLYEDGQKSIEIPVFQRILRPAMQLPKNCHFCSKTLSADSSVPCRCLRFAYCNTACQQRGEKNHKANCKIVPQVIGQPFLISLPSKDVPYELLYSTLASYAAYSVDAVQIASESGTSKLPMFFMKPANERAQGIVGRARIEQGNVDLDNLPCLALDWRNNPEVTDYVIVREKRLEQKSEEREAITLTQCLRQFFQEEYLQGNDAWFCPKCATSCPVTKQLRLRRLPPILVIQLKKFSYDNDRQKKDIHVTFPLKGLDMSPYLGHQDCYQDFVYDLYAVVNHYGSAASGHYTAFARRPRLSDSTQNLFGWRAMDDSRVYDIAEEDVVTPAAYLLFYQQRTPRARCSV